MLCVDVSVFIHSCAVWRTEVNVRSSSVILPYLLKRDLSECEARQSIQTAQLANFQDPIVIITQCLDNWNVLLNLACHMNIGIQT